jgi:hypothetical protein
MFSLKYYTVQDTKYYQDVDFFYLSNYIFSVITVLIQITLFKN